MLTTNPATPPQSPRPNLLVLGFVIAAVFLMAALIINAGFSRTTRAVPDAYAHFGGSCQPPCWNGITPGDRMTAAQVEQIIRSTPGTSNVWRASSRSIEWNWSWPPYGRTGRSCYIYLPDDTVTTIFLATRGDLAVADVVARFGNPEVVSHGTAGLPETPYYNLVMYYPTRGITFYVRPETYQRPILEPSTEVTGIVYFAPFATLKEWEPASRPGVIRVPWPGYGPLPRQVSPGGPG